jgi:hypothetical protein
MNKRAITSQQKHEIIDRLFTVWINNPDLRLAQLISIVFGPQDLFYVEDYDFIKELETINESRNQD